MLCTVKTHNMKHQGKIILLLITFLVFSCSENDKAK
jgi:hypothetical protein